MTDESTTRRTLDWLKNPSSILSILAAIISGATFFLLYVQDGNIELTLPQQIGIGIAQDTKKVGLDNRSDLLEYGRSGQTASRAQYYGNDNLAGR